MSEHQRALLLFDQKRFDLAERSLRQLLSTNHGDASAHALLALCLAALGTTRLPEATREAEEAVRLAPDEAFPHYALAHVLTDRNDYRRADAALSEAIRLDPYDANFFALRAQLRANDTKWADALAAADEGLAIDPLHTGCTNLRVVALRQLGRGAEAAAALGSVLERAPEDAATHANQGWGYLQAGDQPQALAHFREALRLDPDMEWARAGIVEALKARHAVYGMMLRYFFRMGRLDASAQWYISIGGIIGYQVLRGVARSTPALAPVIYPVLGLYLLFVLLTWIADPLFNVVLLLDPFGRLALSRDQRIGAYWMGATVVAAFAAAVMWLVTRSPVAGEVAIMTTLITLPLGGTLSCSAGWPRRVMAGITALIAVFPGVRIVSAIGMSPVERSASAYEGWFWIAVLLTVLSSWIGKSLTRVVPKL